MGVMCCSRNGCDNILCDNYSHEYGYLCWECLNELINYGPVDIDDWMSTHKENTNGNIRENWERQVRQTFVCRD